MRRLILALVAGAIVPAVAQQHLATASGSVPAPGPAAVIVPSLPAPPVAEDAPPGLFLQAAAQALAAGRTGEAVEALERAESRALDRAVRPSLANVPDRKPLVQQIAAARAALASGDRGRAMELIQAAIHDPEAVGGSK